MAKRTLAIGDTVSVKGLGKGVIVEFSHGYIVVRISGTNYECDPKTVRRRAQEGK